MNQLIFIAIRNLMRNRRRTLLALGALVVGLTVMTALRGFVNSIMKAQLEATTHGFTGMLQVHKKGYNRNVLSNPLNLSFADSEQLRQKLLAVPGVVAIAPRIMFSGIYSAPEPIDGKTESDKQLSSFFTALAIEPLSEKIVAPKVFDWIVEGEMLNSQSEKGIILNSAVALALKINISSFKPETSEALWPIILASDRDGSLNGEAVRPVGFLGSAMPGDKRFALIQLKLAQKILRMEGQITEFAVSIRNITDAKLVQSKLETVLGPGFEVHRWDELVPFLRDLLENMEIIFGLVTGIFFLVVLLGIINTMFMSVLERTREIGTMMAVGVKTSQIISLFVFEGFFLGCLGGVVGVTLGSGLVLIMQTIGIHITAPGSAIILDLRPFVSFYWIAKSAVYAGIGSAFVSFWPALKASQLKPVEALQSI